MHYIDPHNLPQLAVRNYDVVGGSVIPDLFHGTIFRVSPSSNFSLERLRNQIDGAKFFVEVYNDSASPVTVTFDPDYIDSSLDPLDPANILAGSLMYYEVVCRRGSLLVYTMPEVVTPGLTNPKDGAGLTNPKTGEPLLKVTP